MSRLPRRSFPTLPGLLVALALILPACGRELQPTAHPAGEAPTPTAPPPTEAPAPAAPPGPGTAELLSLIEKGRASTFHARWVAKQNEGGGGEVRIDLWNRPPHGRIDVVIGGSGLSSSAVRNLSGAYQCARNGEEPWRCQPGGQVEPAGVILDAVRQAAVGVELVGADETVVGRPARCFTEAATGQEALCTTTDGIPLRVMSGPQRLEILLLERTVSDSDLEPPGGTGG